MRLQPLQGCTRDLRVFFSSCINNRNLPRKGKKKRKKEKPHQLESEEDEAEKSALLSLIFSLLSKCREIHLAVLVSNWSEQK